MRTLSDPSRRGPREINLTGPQPPFRGCRNEEEGFMTDKNRIDVGVLKLLFDAITGSTQLETMANRMTQLLVGSLGIKGATIFMVNPEFESLEVLATSGLSMNYVRKGPVLVDKSLKLASNREPVVISDVSKSDKLQYPENAKAEGLQAIVSLPITLQDRKSVV